MNPSGLEGLNTHEAKYNNINKSALWENSICRQGTPLKSLILGPNILKLPEGSRERTKFNILITNGAKS